MKPDHVAFYKWLTIAVATIAAWWARIPHAEQSLLVFMAIDLIMGVLGALLAGTFSAKTLFGGIVKKIRTLLFLYAAVVTEAAFMTDLPFDIHKPVTWALCFYELSSLCENYVKYGGKVPPLFLRALGKLGGMFNTSVAAATAKSVIADSAQEARDLIATDAQAARDKIARDA